MWAEESDEPTEANVGRFIPTSQLVHWHNTMKLKFPDIYTADNKLFGNQKRMHGLGTKLKTFFDDDPDKPMNCEVVGSRWQVEFGDRQPMYVVLMGHELTQIAFTGAHEEGGWEAVGGGLMDLDSEDEEDGEEDSDEDEVAVAEVGRAGVGVGSSGGEGGNKDSGDRCSSPHCAKPGAQETCTRCKKAYYCNVKYQKMHWEGFHKYSMMQKFIGLSLHLPLNQFKMSLMQQM